METLALIQQMRYSTPCVNSFHSRFLSTDMADRLASVLQDMARSGELQNAVNLLQRSANRANGNNNERNSDNSPQKALNAFRY